MEYLRAVSPLPFPAEQISPSFRSDLEVTRETTPTVGNTVGT
jgi:hypothetical protein